MQNNSYFPGHAPVFVEQFQAVADLFRSVGYGKNPVPLLTSIISPKTLDLDGEHENANGYTAKFFEEADTVARFTKSKKPLIRGGVLTGNEYIAAIMGFEVELNQLASTLTQTEVNEIMEKLGDHVVVFELGGREIINDRMKNLVGGQASVTWHSDGQSTPVTSRGLVQRPGVAVWFPEPLILAPGTRIECRVEGNKTWTTTDDLPLLVSCPALVGERGAPDELGKGVIVTLSQANAAKEQFKKQIDLGA